jgi:RNA-directed DNA polymerase
MIDSSIEYSVSQLWEIWRVYRKGKKQTKELAFFEYNLLDNITLLARDLRKRNWKHEPYRFFEVNDTKKRLVSVASVRDKIVHRFVYEQLSNILKNKIDFDVWSGRKDKGLLRAIRRTQIFAKKYKSGYVLKIDIQKCFDSIDQKILVQYIEKRVDIPQELASLCTEIIFSYNTHHQKGLPIGNVTSHIFCHLYLSCIDYVIRSLSEIRAYVRYGDDMLCFLESDISCIKIENKITQALHTIGLSKNQNSSYIRKISHGFNFLGCVIYPQGRKLLQKKRLIQKITSRNFSSYTALFKKHDKELSDYIRYIDRDIT